MARDSPIPPSEDQACRVVYRSTGLGIYGSVIRYVGMPLEKIALFTNSSQVSGTGQIGQAVALTFSKNGERCYYAPYRVVGPASLVSWFLQYSIMGMVFQLCDAGLSSALGIERVPYGSQIMEDPSLDDERKINDPPSANGGTFDSIKNAAKLFLAPIMSGSIEACVANRAEVQRHYGLDRFKEVESTLYGGRKDVQSLVRRFSGAAFIANASRNTVMSASSFVITPILYRRYYPQEQKCASSLFWFGLGINIFVGNCIAITQQALWGRALGTFTSSYLDNFNASKLTLHYYFLFNPYKMKLVDSVASPILGEPVKSLLYRNVIKEGWRQEGMCAFLSRQKWASRVLMNAPAQGTLPWFYNEILPLGETAVLDVYSSMRSKIL